ncbi:MAG: LCP family protein [Chloroflexota bacterium]|nr:LCP family protein [Chloroflexota bacterium]
MSSAPSPALAAVLSFVFPGLGQVYAGEVRRGLLWAIPMALFIVAVIWLLLGGQVRLLTLIATEQSRLALLILNVAFFAYHLAAMFDAYSVAKHERVLMGGSAAGAPVALTALVILAVLLHGVPQAVGIWGSAALDELLPKPSNVIPSFSLSPLPETPSPSPTATPTQTVTPSGPTTTPTGGVSPTPTDAPRNCPQVDPNWAMAADGRVNLLLVGSDSRSEEGELGGSSLRTDTMILLSIETATCKAAMFGFPRNMTNAPLDPEARNAYPGGRFPELLNALWRRAAERPESFPGSDGISGTDCARSFDCICGWRALTGTVQQMAGVQVDAVVAVNLHGFVALVDAVGGVWLDIPQRVQDPRYPTSDGRFIKIDIPKGCDFFDGEMALAYARSRRQDSDYQRMRRQQYVLAQVRKQFDPLALLPRAPQLLGAAQENLFTTIADADLPHLAQLASAVDADRLYQVRFVKQRFNTDADIAEMRRRVRDIFGEREPRPTPTPSGRPASCPAPGQTPRP